MADRSAAQLVEVRLVELKRVDDSYSQDYAKVHERLARRLEKEAHPLSSDTVSLVSDELVAWLATLAAKNYSPDRLSHMLRVGLGHLCTEYIVVNPHLPQEEVAIRAYAELQRRGWDLATYDPEVAQAALKRMQSLEASRGKSKKPSSSAKADSNKKVICNPKIAEAKASKATPAKKEALMALEKKSSPVKAKKTAAKKTVAEKATAKKPVAKKASAVKATSAAKAGVKKPAAKKASAVKATSAAKAGVKKPAAKKASAVKAISPAKAVGARKAVAKKAVARKPAAKKSAAKKPAIEPKPASSSSPMEEKKHEFI
jgi:histone H1/5